MGNKDERSHLMRAEGLAALLVIAAVLIRIFVSAGAAFLNKILLVMLLGALAIAAIPFLGKVKGRGGSANSSDTVFKAYEDGKHRRYTLLFAVNGGAFAVVELVVNEMEGAGTLTIPQISYGMIIFAAIMCFDILAFGLKLRAQSLGGQDAPSVWEGLFALPGWIVLGALWLLISVGWALAGSS